MEAVTVTNGEDIVNCIKNIFDPLPVAFIILSPDWRILECNRAFNSLTGLSLGEIESSSPFLYGIKPPENGSREMAGGGRECEESLAFISYIRKKDGSIMPVNIYLGQVRDNKGNILKYYAVVEPKPQCTIRMPRELECITEPVLLVDGNGYVMSANKEALAMLKKDARDVVGKKLIDLYRRPSYTLFYKKFVRCQEERRASGLEDFDQRLNKWFDIRFYPCSDGTIAHFRDITLRKYQDWWLRMMTFALDEVREPVLLADTGGRVLYINAAASEALGYKKDKIRAMKVFDIIGPFPAGQWDEYVKMAKNKGNTTFEAFLAGKGRMAPPAQIVASYLRFFNVEYICLVANAAAGD